MKTVLGLMLEDCIEDVKDQPEIMRVEYLR